MQSGPHEEAAVSGDSIARILREGNKETFAAAKDVIMHRVLLATVQEAIEGLGSPEAIAERALGHVDEQHTALRQATDTLKERLLEAIARRATDELSDPKTTALQAQERIELGHKAIITAKNLLKQRLLEDVAQDATDELTDPDSIARQARACIDDTAGPLARGQKTLTNLLIAEVADRSTNELANPRAVARQARARIDDAHMVVTGAVDQLKRRLIDEIIQRSTDALADPEAAARQAQALIDPEHTVLLKAVDKLKEQLLESIVQESLARISGTMRAAPADPEPIKAASEETPPAEVAPAKTEPVYTPPAEATPPNRAPAAARRAKKSYVKTQVVQTREAVPPSASEAPRAPSPAPQMQRRKAANGYEADGAALPASEPAENAEAAPQARHYVYGVVGKHGLALADALAEAAIDPPYTPYLMPCKSVTAIVGNLPSTALDPADETWQDDARRVQERVLEHVNAAGFAVLPMYAHTVHTNPAYLEKALDKYAETLHTALATLAGKHEWNVKIYCDASKVKQEVHVRDEDIETFLEHFAATAALWSEASVEAEIEAVREGLETPLPEVIDSILSNCQSRIHRTLHAVSIDSRVAPASEDSVFGNSNMVLNASYLVVEARGKAFRAVLEQLSSEYEQLGLVYYIGGPHTPCRFAPSDVPTL